MHNFISMNVWISLYGSACPVGQEVSRNAPGMTESAIHSPLDNFSRRVSSIGSDFWHPLHRIREPGFRLFSRASLGHKLDRDELRVPVGLRIDAPLVRAHKCICGAEAGLDLPGGGLDPPWHLGRPPLPKKFSTPLEFWSTPTLIKEKCVLIIDKCL